MHLHRIGLILVIVAIESQISWASTQCKTAVMDVHMKRCRGDSRIKRDLDLLKLDDTLKHDEKLTQEDLADSFKDDDLLPHGTPQKRQQLLEQVTGEVTQPIVHLISNAIPKTPVTPVAAVAPATSILPLPGQGLINNPGLSSLIPLSTPGLSQPNRLAPILYLLKLRPLNPDYSDDLRYDLAGEELDELYNDIYERRPRGSKEEAWKAFLETASKCCQNVDKCLKDPTYIPCLI